MFNKYGVNYTGPTSPMEEKPKEKPKKEPIVYERVDTTPEIYDDEEIPWTAEKDKLFLEGFYSRSQDNPEIVVIDKTKKKPEITTAPNIFDPKRLKIQEKKTSSFEEYKPTAEDMKRINDTQSVKKVNKVFDTISKVNQARKDSIRLAINSIDPTSFVRGKIWDYAWDKTSDFVLDKATDIADYATREYSHKNRMNKIEQANKIKENTYPKPNIQKFNIDGKEIIFNSADKYGVGILPDGTMVVGDVDKDEKMQKFNSAIAEDPSAIEDYKIHDATEFIEDFIKKRAEEFAYLKDANPVDKLISFALLVAPETSGDLKSYPNIKNQDLYLYNGEIVHREDLGNIAYGHLGKVLGIPDGVLKAAAGLVQIAAGYIREKADYKPNPAWKYEFYEDPRDARWVERGIDKYEREKRK